MSTGKWAQQGVPHKGWKCIDYYDIRDTSDSLVICEMCERQEIRYIHVMRHDNYPDDLEVGCVCAEHMEQGYSTPNSAARSREGKLGRRGSRRRNWLNLNAWNTRPNGNMTISKKNLRATVYFKFGKWSWVFNQGDNSHFASSKFNECDQARLDLFDAMDRILNPQDYPQTRR